MKARRCGNERQEKIYHWKAGSRKVGENLGKEIRDTCGLCRLQTLVVSCSEKIATVLVVVTALTNVVYHTKTL